MTVVANLSELEVPEEIRALSDVLDSGACLVAKRMFTFGKPIQVDDREMATRVANHMVDLVLETEFSRRKRLLVMLDWSLGCDIVAASIIFSRMKKSGLDQSSVGPDEELVSAVKKLSNRVEWVFDSGV